MKIDEAKAAELLSQLGDFVTVLGEGGLAGLKTRFDEMKAKISTVESGFASLDFAKVAREVEVQKARQDDLIRTIKSSRKGLYVSGLEDQPFNLLRACLGVKQGGTKNAFERIDGGHEFEVMHAVQQKHGEEIRKMTHFMKTAQNTGTDSLGGNFVPDQVIPDVIAGIYTRSAFINLTGEGVSRVSVLEGLTGANVKIPKFLGGLIAYWIGEEDPYTESNTRVGDVTMNPKKMGILARLTDSMQKFSGFGFDTLFRNDMMRAAAKKLDWTVMYGPGSDNAPRGITKVEGIKIYSAQSKLVGVLGTDALGGAQFQADWTGAELDFDGLDNMKLALEEDDIALDSASGAIISAPRYFTRLRQLKVENYSGQVANLPYLLGMPMLNEQRLQELIGPFGKSNQFLTTKKPGVSVGAPSASGTAKFTDVVLGNLSEVVLGRWAGLEIEDDAGRGAGFPSDSTYVKLRIYADLGYRQPRALVVCPDAKARS